MNRQLVALLFTSILSCRSMQAGPSPPVHTHHAHMHSLFAFLAHRVDAPAPHFHNLGALLFSIPTSVLNTAGGCRCFDPLFSAAACLPDSALAVCPIILLGFDLSLWWHAAACCSNAHCKHAPASTSAPCFAHPLSTTTSLSSLHISRAPQRITSLPGTVPSGSPHLPAAVFARFSSGVL